MPTMIVNMHPYTELTGRAGLGNENKLKFKFKSKMNKIAEKAMGEN